MDVKEYQEKKAHNERIKEESARAKQCDVFNPSIIEKRAETWAIVKTIYKCRFIEGLDYAQACARVCKEHNIDKDKFEEVCQKMDG